MKLKGVLLLVVLLMKELYCQASFPFIEHISIEQGFLQSTVNCILQDSKGFVWFGTNDGLNRYDGYTFKTFRNNPSDPNSLAENYVTALSEDVNGNIWAGTASGYLNMFDGTGSFFSFRLNNHSLFVSELPAYDIPPCYSAYTASSVTCILTDKFGYVWAGTFGSGIFQYDPLRNTYLHYYHTAGENSLSSNYVLTAAEGVNGDIWIGTYSGGLNRLSRTPGPGEGEFIPVFSVYQTSSKNIKSITSDNITALVVKDKVMWAATYGGGICRRNISAASNDSSFYPLQPTNSLSSSFVTCLVFDQDDNMWIGTIEGGLNKYEKHNNRVSVYKNNPLNDNSIDNNDIVSLAAGNSGLIWIGTLTGYGVNKLNPSRARFTHYKNEPLLSGSLSDNVVTAFAEDHKGNIWIGTYSGGLNKFNPANNTFISYRHNSSSGSISSNYITSILVDKDNNLWIGTYMDGLNYFTTANNKFITYRYNKDDESSVSSNKISAIEQDRNGIIWVGTRDAGINKAVRHGEAVVKFITYKSSSIYSGNIAENNILKMFNDYRGKLRVLTSSGYLSTYNEVLDEFTSTAVYKGKEAILINSILPDNDKIWIGTINDGLFLYNTGSGKLDEFSTLYRLKNKTISGILKYKNDLWISTNYGIVKYNISSKTTISYNIADGLQSLKYNGGACIRLKDGRMLFGGINGFNIFNPEFPGSRKYKNSLFISQFNAGNKIIPLLNNSIELSPFDNSFSIDFASKDFRDPARNEFLFILSGYDKEWKYSSGNNHTASYTDLPPGEYTFLLKGSDSEGVWTDKPLMIKVYIAQVFWKTWWFILLGVLIIALTSAYFIYMRINRYLEVDKLKTKLSADLHDSVGSGLTEISLLSEVVQRDYRKNSGSQNNAVEIISQRSRELIDNMSDIVWLVNPAPASFNDLVMRLKAIYYPLLQSMNKDFKVDIPDSFLTLKLSLEKRQNIYLIFKEAINNALKYSCAKRILLSARDENNMITMELYDNGKGFDPASASGNGLKNMALRAKTINAELAIRSTAGNGTIITLVIRK